jgi:hypothetical protein
MRKDRRSHPETSASLVPPRRKPLTAVGTATLPEPSGRSSRNYPQRRTPVQRVATVLLGSSCLIGGGLLVMSGVAGLWPIEVVLLAAGAGISWRGIVLNRAMPRTMSGRRN